MRTQLRSPAAIVFLLFIAFQFTGCGSSPPARFYTLSSLAVPGETGDSLDGQKRQVVAIGPVALADYLENPAITTRSGPNTLTRSEFDRWGGSLRNEVTRVLVENMGQLMTGDAYLVLPWLETEAASYRLQLNITRFEGTSEGPVVLNAGWMIFGGERSSMLESGHASITKPVLDSGYAAISDAMSRALAELSRQIAGELKTASNAQGTGQ
ncbi:MAG: PqiC family protein [Desulfuromonadales bacterium]